MPAGWNTFRSCPSQTPHSVSGGSLECWKTSTWVPHERQTYSYVGMLSIIGAVRSGPEKTFGYTAYLAEEDDSAMKVKKAVIPAAGLGTRFLPATKSQPKEMLPLVDKPAIQFVVEEAVRSGIHDLLIVTGRGKRTIEDHFDRAFELEYYLHQKGKNDLLEEL